jgi:hypothetical protein
MDNMRKNQADTVFEAMEQKLAEIELQAKKKVETVVQNNKKTNELFKKACWWDKNPCPYYSEIKGLIESGHHCYECSRVDWEVFRSRVEHLNASSILLEQAKNEGEEEGIKIAGEILVKEIVERIKSYHPHIK